MYVILRSVTAAVPLKLSFAKPVEATVSDCASSLTSTAASCHGATTAKLVISQFNSFRPITPHTTFTTHSCGLLVANNTHTHTFNGSFSGTTQVSRYQKGKTNLDITEARDSEWQWHQLGHMQVCTLLQTDNHTSTPPLLFLQAGCPSSHLTNSIKALKAISVNSCE